MSDRDRELAAMAEYRRSWKKNLKRKSLSALVQEYEAFEEMVIRYPWHIAEDGRILEELHHLICQMEDRAISAAQRDCPIAFFKPSWEQAQALNAWHPAYEPESAPEGYRNVCNFSAKRTAKTWGMAANIILWIVPNDREWPIFDPYTDHLGRHVQVLPRFNWDYWRDTGKIIEPLPGEPPKGASDFWIGVPDETHWYQKIEPVLRGNKKNSPGMPPRYIAREKGQEVWMKAEKYFRTVFGHTVSAKLYGSETQAWSGDEVFLVSLDEGVPRDKLDEAYIRSKYLHWSYTPYEPANTGDKARLARQVYKGDYQLIGKTKFFFFKMRDVANHVMAARDRDERIAVATKRGGLELVAIEGGFHDSSPQVFDHFEPAFHILPLTGAQIVAAVRGESHPDDRRKWPWLELFLDANLFRGFDEGMAHPSACAWMALLQTGEWVLYREWEQPAHSITERVEKIIDMSGNLRVQVNRGLTGVSEDEFEQVRLHAPALIKDAQRERDTGTKLTRYREETVRERIRKTIADSKIFRRDPNFPLDDWTENYIRAGLKMERAANIGPAARCDFVNGLFRVEHSRRHLNPEQSKDGAGCGLYFAADCVIAKRRFEEYLHGQIKSGSRTGEFTGKPDALDDDLIDAVCLVGETLVTTKHGDVPICNIKVGDFVLTRLGYKRVLKCGKTQDEAEIWQLRFDNGGFIHGTANHPVYVEGKGFIRLDAVCYGDTPITSHEQVVRAFAPEKLGEKRPVFNISVEDAPEYFANGILVHNCYPPISRLRWKKYEPEHRADTTQRFQKNSVTGYISR